MNEESQHLQAHILLSFELPNLCYHTSIKLVHDLEAYVFQNDKIVSLQQSTTKLVAACLAI